MHKWASNVIQIVSTTEPIGRDVTSKKIYLQEDITAPNAQPYYLLEVGQDLSQWRSYFSAEFYVLSDGEDCWNLYQSIKAPTIRTTSGPQGGQRDLQLKVGSKRQHSSDFTIAEAIGKFLVEFENNEN